jgi:hypothetical protein
MAQRAFPLTAPSLLARAVAFLPAIPIDLLSGEPPPEQAIEECRRAGLAAASTSDEADLEDFLADAIEDPLPAGWPYLAATSQFAPHEQIWLWALASREARRLRMLDLAGLKPTAPQDDPERWFYKAEMPVALSKTIVDARRATVAGAALVSGVPLAPWLRAALIRRWHEGQQAHLHLLRAFLGEPDATWSAAAIKQEGTSQAALLDAVIDAHGRA